MNRLAHVPEWTLLSLRPRGQHAALRRAAAALGAQVVGLSPWALVARHDAATRTALAQALEADRVVFSSPAAVHAAARLQALGGPHAGTWLAVGAGTAAALRSHGATDVQAPQRMDSEGLLDLPGLASLHGLRAALVTAPGGRGIIADTLQARGAQLQRVDVYRRQPLRLAPRQLQRLRHHPTPWVLALSSAEALALLQAQLPPDLLARVQAQPVVAASPRLAALAEDAGFGRVRLAEGPLPVQLVRAAHAAITTAQAS
ncbi:uroporphyrinogen-III synthase [Stenotrophomonas sp. NPDC077464]|uniref:uroporphyrinogen-III synthase n=1 Tax=unclassified Stenotrophomonas TaxID=196198 RepID=UPI0037D362D2